MVEWRFHSRQAGSTHRATNPQTGGRRPKKRLLRQVSPPGARGTVADGPSRYWCTYKRRCGNAGPKVLTQGGHARGRPSQGTVGSNPGTGGHQPKAGIISKTMSVTAISSWTSANTCQRSRVAVVLCFGAWCVALGSLLLFPSLFSSLAFLLTLCQLRSCLRQFSSPVTDQSSFRSCFTQYPGGASQAVGVVTSD